MGWLIWRIYVNEYDITNPEIAYLGYECGDGCSGINYDLIEKEIKLICRIAHLSDIYNQLNDRIILNSDASWMTVIIEVIDY